LYDLPKACSGIALTASQKSGPIGPARHDKATATSRTDHEFVLQPPAMTEANVAQA